MPPTHLFMSRWYLSLFVGVPPSPPFVPALLVLPEFVGHRCWYSPRSLVCCCHRSRTSSLCVLVSHHRPPPTPPIAHWCVAATVHARPRSVCLSAAVVAPPITRCVAATIHARPRCARRPLLLPPPSLVGVPLPLVVSARLCLPSPTRVCRRHL